MTTYAVMPTTETISLDTVICDNMRIALAMRKKNQADLARAFGVSSTLISQKMRGITSWTISDMAKAGKYLGIAPSRFLDPNGLVSNEWGRRGLNPGPADLWSAGPGSKPERGIMQCFTLAA